MSGGACGATASDLTNWGLVANLGPVSGVVPNGVATVTVHYPASDGARAQTATVKVVNNVFVTTLTRAVGGPRVAPTIEWRSASGKTIKTVSRRGPGMGGGWCGGIGCITRTTP